MKYTMTDEEKAFANDKITKFIENGEEFDFSGTTISPYNLREAMLERGFEEVYLDSNSFDNWNRFKYKDIEAVVYFDGRAFTLVLRKA